MPTSTMDQPTALASLVDYQAGSVVSRVLAKTAGGSVTLFAFDADQELSEHSAPFDALLHVADGSMDVRVGERTHSVGTGAILRLPAAIPHAVRAPVRAKMLLVMLREPKPDR